MADGHGLPRVVDWREQVRSFDGGARALQHARLRDRLEILELRYYEAQAVWMEAASMYQRTIGGSVVAQRKARLLMRLAEGATRRAQHRWLRLLRRVQAWGTAR